MKAMSHTLNSGDPPVPQKPTITPHSGISDGSAFAQQQECRVPFGNVEHLLELTPVLRQIDDTVILLHYPGMF